MDEVYITLKKLGLPPANNVLRHGDKVEYYKHTYIDFVTKWLSILSKTYNYTVIIQKNESFTYNGHN